jgi:hypothetical protein
MAAPIDASNRGSHLAGTIMPIGQSAIPASFEMRPGERNADDST